VAAAIGMAIGAGLGMLALAATVLVLIVLAVFLRFERRFLRRQHLRDEQSSALDGDSPAA